MLAWNSQKNEMAFGSENCIATRWTMGQENNQMEPMPQHQREDKVNDFLKPEETEETKGNDIKNKDTWIKVAKNRERWKAMESDYAVAAARVE